MKSLWHMRVAIKWGRCYITQELGQHMTRGQAAAPHSEGVTEAGAAAADG